MSEHERAATALSWVAAIVIGTTGCVPSDSSRREDPAIEVTHAPVRLIGDSAVFALPTAMVVVGEYLVVVDDLSSNAITVIHTATGHIANQIAPRGDGLHEVRTPWVLFPESSDPPRVWTFDLVTRHFTLWNLLAAPEDAAVRRIQYRGPLAPASRPVIMRDAVLAADLRNGYSLAIYDSTGSVVFGHAGTPPFDGTVYPDDTSPIALANANEFFITVNPARTRLALLYKRAGRIDVYDVITGNVEASTTTHVLPPPKLGHGKAQFEAHSNGQSATDQFVYSMYCDCDVRGRRPLELVRFVRIYDWNATHIFDYGLDRYVSAIAVSPNDSILYGAMQEPVPMIGEWILPRSDLTERRKEQ